MENASKAILIAATVFIVLLIVSLGIVFLFEGREIAGLFNNKITDTKITEHNSIFLLYDGEITGQQVVELVIKASNNNRYNPDIQVEILLPNRTKVN